ncbi:dimethyl sulfoxide reductase anchor subunit family protein [Desulfovibrio sp. Fe33]|uniref:dimethyl sulfoxide reductase anchor subunit family protein n=1 Tax=Desulfovibrio sp. Fe33 TaxID=3020842 RepID=UPI00234D977A|nr:DmsC/YnfH family molybdoenzyme membrane anchor subunit [Desulfovibrio sp. Fe33]
MFSSDWSLVLFTILVQSAVGIVVITEAARLFAGASGSALRWQTPVACVMTALGLILSLTHLGTPLHSVFTIMNLGNSWLSREILSVSAFFIAICALAFMRMRNDAVKATGLSVLAMALGLLAVFVMTKVYLLETVPAWNSVATAFSFYGTMLLAGAVASGVIGSIENSGKDCGEDCTSVTGLLCASAQAGLALKFIAVALGMIALGSVGSLGTSGLDLVAGEGVSAQIVRIAMICAGAGVFTWFGFKAMGTRQLRLAMNPALCALALVMAGEIIDRLMFYGTYMRIGI